MKQRLGPSKEGATTLANVLVLRAMAEHADGQERDALWYWHVAQALDPTVATRDYSRFGKLAVFLKPDQAKAPADSPDDTQIPPSSITPPRAIRSPHPRYPAGAREFGVSGTLVVLGVIDTDGLIYQPRVLQALPAPTLTWAALEALKEWRFKPAQQDGKPVSVWYNLSVHYRIQ